MVPQLLRQASNVAQSGQIEVGMQSTSSCNRINGHPATPIPKCRYVSAMAIHVALVLPMLVLELVLRALGPYLVCSPYVLRFLKVGVLTGNVDTLVIVGPFA